ncbi:MAG: hypothetical protein ABJF01_01560 [bacterium]
MAIAYAIDVERGVVMARASGTFVADDIRIIRDQLAVDPAFRSSYNQLFDLRDVTDFAIPSPSIDQISGTSIVEPGVRRALVARSGIQFGLARMFATMSEKHGHIVRVFRDLEAAMQWLLDGAAS